MIQGNTVIQGLCIMATLASSTLFAAEGRFQASVTILHPATISSSYDASSNTLWIQSRGRASYSLDLPANALQRIHAVADGGTEDISGDRAGRSDISIQFQARSRRAQQPTVLINYN